MERILFCIDLKCFYASVECSDLNYDPFTTPLAVVDKDRGPNSVVLAISPYLKSLGVKSRCRLKDLPTTLSIIYIKPRMQRYIDVSTEIIGIYLDFIAEEDLHVYSIDEAFLDFTTYLSLYKKEPIKIAKDIADVIYKKTKIIATIGISFNLFMAKVCMDNEAKYAHENHYIAQWRQEDIEKKLWKITPITDMWGIGHGLGKKLHAMGIESIGDLAHYNPHVLKQTFGVIGTEIHNHANGIDLSFIQEKPKHPHAKSFSLGQCFYQDYHHDTIKTVIKEMVFQICKRLHKHQFVTQGVSLSLGYHYQESITGKGMSIQLEQKTDSEKIIRAAVLQLLEKIHHQEIIRKIHISVFDLSCKTEMNLNLFESLEEGEKEEQLLDCLLKIEAKYQKGSVYKAVSFLKEGTTRSRNTLIGGHNAK